MTIWTKDQMASIHKMLNPKSFAIVGATPRQQYGGRMLNGALRMRDRVNIYAVNPKYDEILGLPSLGLTASVALPLGYRAADDKYAGLPKPTGCV